MSRGTRHAEGVVRRDAPAVLEPVNGDSLLVVDFGRETVGRIILHVDAEQGTTLSLFYGEDLEEALRTADFTCGWYHLPQDHLELAAGPSSVSNYGRRAFRYVALRLPAGSAPVRVASVEAMLVHYQVRFQGSFSCSDPLLNRIWDTARHTTLLCMQQYYEDGVKRDGLLWVGDYRVQFLCSWFCFGDAELARKSLYMIASTQREDGAIPAAAGKAGGHQHPANIEYMPGVPEPFHNEWIILNYNTDYIGAVREYIMLTGDRAILKDLWPSVVRTMRFLMRSFRMEPFEHPGSTMITDCPYWHPEGWWPSHAAFLMQALQAVRDMDALAEMAGDDGQAAEWSGFADRLSSVLDSHYYDQAAGLYRDYADSADRERTTSWHAHAFAVLSGKAEAAEGGRMFRALAGIEDAIKPVAGLMNYYVLEAMFRSGLAEQALADIRSYYGFMLDRGATSFWDVCDPKHAEKYKQDVFAYSHCHGWTAGPNYLLPVHVLGVKTRNGFQETAIEPSLGGLAWAEGEVPTPMGDLYVRWEQTDSGMLTGVLDIPQGVNARIRLPDGRQATAGAGRYAVDPAGNVNRLG